MLMATKSGSSSEVAAAGGSSSSNGSSSKTTTVTTTKYTSSSGEQQLQQQQHSISGTTFVRPIASAKTIFVQRTLPDYSGRDSVDSTIVSKRVSHSFASMPPASAQQAAADVNNMLTGREKEKKDMQELNERFATYIEKVRFLEAQNRKLSDELQKLRDSWGQESGRVKDLYEVEMEQLRRLLDESDKQRSSSEVRITSLEDQLNELQLLLEEANRQHQIDREANEKLSNQMADYDSEISLLRRRCAGIDDERAKTQTELTRLRADVARLRADLDTETLNHVHAANEAQSLREQLEFLKATHEAERKELAALAYRDTTPENREYWRSEMAQALRDIRDEYEAKISVVRSEIESQYSVKVQEVRTSGARDNLELAHLKEENKRLKSQAGETRSRVPELEARNGQMERELEELRRQLEEAERESEMQMNQLRADLASSNATLEEYLREMQVLMDAKLSLELEIHAYRKLLEGEEVRISQTSISRESSSFSQRSQSQTVTQQQQAQQQMSIIKGEMSAKTNYQRTAKGSISIQECSTDGTFLVLENTGKKKEDVSEWKITRNIDNGKQTVKILIPANTSIESGEKNALKIWAKGLKPAGSSDLESSESNFGVGLEIRTVLSNADGEERATHTQKTTYTAN